MRGVMYLVWMECQTAGGADPLSQESLVVLDGTQIVPRRVVYTDELVRGTTATTDNILLNNLMNNLIKNRYCEYFFLNSFSLILHVF